MLAIKPITFREAKQFNQENHRHNPNIVGCKFCVSCVDESGQLHGVAICGRPVSRHLDDGETLEINRVCTDGTRNACSKLYGACFRIAKEMGYTKIVTYTLQSEDGTSLKAAGYTFDGEAGGVEWTGIRKRGQNIPHEKKYRWVKYVDKGGGGFPYRSQPDI